MVFVSAVFIPEHFLHSGPAAHVAHQCDVVARLPLSEEVQSVDYLILLEQKRYIVLVEH